MNKGEGINRVRHTDALDAASLFCGYVSSALRLIALAASQGGHELDIEGVAWLAQYVLDETAEDLSRMAEVNQKGGAE